MLFRMLRQRNVLKDALHMQQNYFLFYLMISLLSRVGIALAVIVFLNTPLNFCMLLCRRNQISSFPTELCSLPLQVLNLSNNKLCSLPVEIGLLTLLQDLVSASRLSSILVF